MKLAVTLVQDSVFGEPGLLISWDIGTVSGCSARLV